jgi:putative hydrolase of the HAD superfamily
VRRNVTQPLTTMMIFFDIDGTLIDQRKAETAAAGEFLKVYGALLERSYTLEQFCGLWRRLRDRHARGFLDGRVSWVEQQRRRMRDLFAAREPRLCDAEADARFAFYRRRYRESWTLYHDVAAALQALAGCRLGIVSNGNLEQQKAKLRRTGIEHLFSVVLISEQAGVAKPDPKIFLAACRRARCAPHEAVHVGDHFDLDIRPSHAVGMRALWLDRIRSGVPTSGIEVIHSLTQLAQRVGNRSAA